MRRQSDQLFFEDEIGTGDALMLRRCPRVRLVFGSASRFDSELDSQRRVVSFVLECSRKIESGCR